MSLSVSSVQCSVKGSWHSSILKISPRVVLSTLPAITGKLSFHTRSWPSVLLPGYLTDPYGVAAETLLAVFSHPYASVSRIDFASVSWSDFSLSSFGPPGVGGVFCRIPKWKSIQNLLKSNVIEAGPLQSTCLTYTSCLLRA